MFWGTSEALDFVEEYKETNEFITEPLNILLFGSCDPRHIIQTIAKSYKHDTEVNFYVVDGCIEIIARNILLIGIALESAESLTLLQKTHLFMDIYGNSLIRPSSYQYLTSKTNTLLKICTDPEVNEKLAPIIDIEFLKYRERDDLTNTFNFWRPKEANKFNILKYWEMRNRQVLKTRYDHRDGAFDWDLQMCLKERGAKQLCPQEYKTFRENGLAFTFPEYEQCKANKTLAAGLIRDGEKYHNRGYVGDVQVGPFCTFGFKSSEESMLKSMHGANDYRATEVTERNLLELFFEIQNRDEYVHDLNMSKKYGSVTLQDGKNFVGHDSELVETVDYDQPMIPTPNFKVFFLSMDEVFGMQENSQWTNKFNVGFIAQNYFRFLKQPFINIFRNNSIVYFETNLFTVCRNEMLTEFEEKIKKFAKKGAMDCLTNLNINTKHSILKYCMVKN